jgi:hypothetical protein
LPVKERQLNRAQFRQLEARRQHLLDELDRAYAPHLIVAALVEVGLNAADLSVATGANKRTVAQWIDGGGRDPKKKIHNNRLADLKEVARLVVEDGTIAFQEADWLRHRNRGAEFATPLQLIGRDEWLVAVRVYCDDVAIPLPAEFLPAEGSPAEPKGAPHSVGAP